MGYKFTNLSTEEKSKLIKTVINLRDDQGLLWKDIVSQCGINERTLKKVYKENR